MLARVVVHETGPGSKVVHRLEDVRDVHVSSPDNHLASTGRGLRVGARLLRFRAIRAPVWYPRGMDLGHLAILAGSGPTMFTKQVSRPGVRSGSPTVAARRSMSSETRRKTGHGPMRGSCAPSRFALPRARPCVFEPQPWPGWLTSSPRRSRRATQALRPDREPPSLAQRTSNASTSRIHSCCVAPEAALRLGSVRSTTKRARETCRVGSAKTASASHSRPPL
jgi:hypothetical protein